MLSKYNNKINNIIKDNIHFEYANINAVTMKIAKPGQHTAEVL